MSRMPRSISLAVHRFQGISALALLLGLTSACSNGGGGTCLCGEPPEPIQISGTFTDEAGHPLAGVAVNNSPVKTGIDGKYTYSYVFSGTDRIYAQPWDGTTCYETSYSSKIVDTGQDMQTIDLVFKPTTPGQISGGITPPLASGESYQILIYQKQVADGKEFYLPIRWVDAGLEGTANQYQIPGLPAGDFRLDLFCTQTNGTQHRSATLESDSMATLAAGGTTTKDLVFKVSNP